MEFRHVGVHRKSVSRLLLGALAGNAEVRATAVSQGMGRKEIIAWSTGLLVGLGLTAAVRSVGEFLTNSAAPLNQQCHLQQKLAGVEYSGSCQVRFQKGSRCSIAMPETYSNQVDGPLPSRVQLLKRYVI